MLDANKCPLKNIEIVLRKETDDWAILFDPNSGETYGLDPVSVFIWEKFDGKHSIEDIVNILKNECINDVPKGAMQEVTDFVNNLVSKGLATFNLTVDA